MEAQKSETKTVHVNMEDLFKNMVGDGKGMQNFAGLCGLPEEGMKVSITASAEIQIAPLEKENKAEVKKK